MYACTDYLIYCIVYIVLRILYNIYIVHADQIDKL